MSKRQSSLVVSVAVIFLTLILASVAGATHSVRIGDRLRVYTDTGSQAFMQGQLLGMSRRILFVGKLGELRIDSVTTKESTTVVFEALGAIYDTSAKSLVGVNKSGDSTILPMSDLDTVDITMLLADRAVKVRFAADKAAARLTHGATYARAQWSIPLDSVQSIEVWRKADNTTGYLLSMAIGLACGLAVGEIGYESCDPHEFNFGGCASRSEYLAEWGVIGLGAGFLVGKSFAKKDTWRPLPPNSWNVQLGVVHRITFGLLLSSRF